MPTPPGVIAKLQALINRLDEGLAVVQRSRGREHDREFYDPLDVGEWCVRWDAIRKVLIDDPDLSDLPARGAPPVEPGSDFDGRGLVKRLHVERLRKDMLDAMDIISHPARKTAQLAIDREGIFVAGQPFDAMLAITSIIRGAKAAITLVDGYVSDETLSLLTTKADSVAPRILTYAAGAPLVAAAKAFNAQFSSGPPLELRTSKKFHDRFVVIDDADCYHFGTSIKDAAKKNAFMFSRIEEPDVVTTLKKAISAEWGAATVVAL